MSLSSIYNITASAMHVQSIRLNTVASNLANVQSASKTGDGAYRARQPIIRSEAVQVRMPDSEVQNRLNGNLFSVTLDEIMQSEAPVEQRYQPDHPYADKNGLVYYSNVDAAHETASMMAASREFESAVSIMNSARKMQDQLLDLISTT